MSNQKKSPRTDGSRSEGMSQQSPEAYHKPKIVVTVRPGGFLEIFSDQPVDVKFCEHPVVHTGPDEALAERYAESLLPPFWRKLMLPCNVRATHQVTRREPFDIAEQVVSADYDQWLLSCVATAFSGVNPITEGSPCDSV